MNKSNILFEFGVFDAIITKKSINPIICGVKICYLSGGGGGGPQGTPYVLNEGVLWDQFFFKQWEIGLLIPRIQKFSLLSFKLWIWESKTVFIWESEIVIFAENHAKTQRIFLPAIFKWPAKLSELSFFW